MKQSEANQPKFNKLNRAKAAAKTAALAGLLLLPAACSSDGERPSASVAQVESTSKAEQELRNREMLITESALHNANKILDILEKPGSGAEQYAGSSVGNKSAVIGKDGVFPSADDNPNPETFVRLDHFDNTRTDGELPKVPFTDTISFVSAQMFVDSSGNKHFTGITMGFLVSEGNPILDQTEQLSIADFRGALKDTESITVESISGNVYQPSLSPDMVDKDFVVDFSNNTPEVVEALRFADMATDQLTAAE